MSVRKKIISLLLSLAVTTASVVAPEVGVAAADSMTEAVIEDAAVFPEESELLEETEIPEETLPEEPQDEVLSEEFVESDASFVDNDPEKEGDSGEDDAEAAFDESDYLSDDGDLEEEPELTRVVNFENEAAEANLEGVTEEVTNLEDLLGDNETLFETYAGRAMYGTGSARRLFRAYAGSKFSGYSQAVYTKLKSWIENVAQGNVSSSKCAITLEDLGEKDVRWYASDLGMDRITKKTVEDEIASYTVTEAATAAMRAILDVPGMTVVRALLVDCPYDFYWFDKTAGYSYSKQQTLYFEYDEAVDDYYFYVKSGLTYSFCVAAEYSESKTAKTFALDTAATSAVTATVDKAKAIVAAHAGESDWQKLDSYRKEICDLTSYNDSTADSIYIFSGVEATYGNPWQIIWVFDDDPNTNVVCEGYAKAFQYLCDLSDFESDINVYIATGRLYRSSGANESHMWNIVTMEDGRNYLVDVTNCDEGMVGAVGDGRGLFLIGGSGNPTDGYEITIGTRTFTYKYSDVSWSTYNEADLTLASRSYEDNRSRESGTCEHVWDDGVVTKAATCVSTGVKLYTCTLCGETTTEMLPMDPDNHTETKLVGEKTPTCGAAGYSGDLVCASCGQILEEGEVLSVAGEHTWSRDVSKKATCASTGLATDTCTVCGATKSVTLAKLSHIYGAYTVTREPTAIALGYKKRTCSVCGDVQTVSIAKLNPYIKCNVSSLTMQKKQITKSVRFTMQKGDYITSWKSSNTAVLKVSNAGTGSTYGTAGTCTLTAMSPSASVSYAYLTVTLKSGLQKRITVKVQTASVATTGMTLTAPKPSGTAGNIGAVTLVKGIGYQLKTSRTPFTTQDPIIYKSSDPSVVVAYSSGVICGLKNGTARISIRSGGRYATVTVTVKSYITSNVSALALQKKQIYKDLKIGMQPGDYVTSWKSSNTAVFKVTGGVGKTDGKAGTCTITAMSPSAATSTAYLTVTLRSGLKKTLKVTVKP